MHTVDGARRATAADAGVVAQLLHDFNTEFETLSPGVATLTERLHVLLAGEATLAVLTGEPAVGVAVLTLRPNVWFDGPVALLDELYVAPEHRGGGLGSAMLALATQLCQRAGAQLMEINVDEGDVDARRFYERHGFLATDPDTGAPSLYYSRPLAAAAPPRPAPPG
jgi:GNAT superfamily N-acetyltransferase